MTGMASHRVIHRPFPVAEALLSDNVSSTAPFHCGIKYSANIINANTNGNTSTLMALTIIFRQNGQSPSCRQLKSATK